MNTINSCPLCKEPNICNFFQDKVRQYFRCPTCGLIFVSSAFFLSQAEEKSRYDLHQNRPDDPGYRQFLGRIFHPLQQRLAPKSNGLDFGSGPGPTLSVMFKEKGHFVSLYDTFYAHQKEVLKRKYDFITATEVFEHLKDPNLELKRLWNCLKPGGYLGVMTKFSLDQQSFASWHYKNDETHICFYSKETFKWLARLWQAEITFVAKDAAIFQKTMRLHSLLLNSSL